MKRFKQISENNNLEIIKQCKSNFCARLKELREERKLSQKDVAKNLGCAISTYANWEQGRTEPSVYDIYCLLDCFDIDANELFN